MWLAKLPYKIMMCTCDRKLDQDDDVENNGDDEQGGTGVVQADEKLQLKSENEMKHQKYTEEKE